MANRLGAGVSDSAVGQTVAAMIQYGGYTQYAFLPPEKLVPVPEGLDPAEVAGMRARALVGGASLARAGGRLILVVGTEAKRRLARSLERYSV